MRSGPGVDSERLGVADAVSLLGFLFLGAWVGDRKHLLGQIGNQLEVVDNLASSICATLDAERQHATEALLQILLRRLMLIVALQTRV
jgi:hypothetical protein